jgi:hypothetical protein
LEASSRPVIEALEPWLREKLGLISQKTKLAEAIRYALSRWEGLTRFIDDGRIELDNNTVERSIRPIALNRKNALFAGSDGGAEHWATVASLIETCKLNDIDPLAYLTDVLTRIVNGHPNRDIDPKHRFPFATIVTKDYGDFDASSNLNRPGVFRLNIGLSKQTFQTMFGHAAESVNNGSFDFTALNQIMPHPVYAAQHWVCILNPSEAIFQNRVQPLLQFCQ